MYVERIQLTDIKGFTGSRTVDLGLPAQGGWTVLAGRNSSGKSTVLQAIALCLGGPATARGLVTDFGDWISDGSPSGRVGATVVRDEAVDSFVGKGRTPVGALELSMQWVRPDSEGDERPEGLRPIMTGTSIPGDESATRGPWSENPRGWFCAGYGPFRRLVGGSGDAQRLMLAQGPSGRMVSLFHEEASLAEGVTWLIDLRLRELENKKGSAGPLLKTVLALVGDGLLPDEYQISRVTADGLWVERKGRGHSAFPLRAMSDGYRTVASLVLDLVRQINAVYGRLETAATESGGVALLAPGVVLVDEVDAHLHVSWQRKIGGWLREHFPNIQFIVSSHSPYICQAADPGGLIRLPGPNDMRPPEVVDHDLYQRVVYGSGEDAVLSELFGLETPYSSRAEQARARLVTLERKVYAGTAEPDDQAEYEALSELLVSSLSTRVTEVAARLNEDR